MAAIQPIHLGAKVMRITAGSCIGRYRIDERIGLSDTREAYSAFDPRLDCRVTLTLLPACAAPSPEHFAQFARAARTTALINHPNIVAVYDVGEHDGCPFVVSESLQGETLRMRLASGPLPVSGAIRYVRQIAEGLLAAHRLGVVHRDLKPENIFVTSDERVKILDFGLAASREHAGRPQDLCVLSRDATPPGSAGYMSPEQIRGDAIDERSDLFSLGAILYELIAGEPAFAGRSTLETLDAILEQDPPSLGGIDRMTSEIEHVIRHCLEKDRRMRFQSARDFLFALDLAVGAPRPPLHPGTRRDSLAWLPFPVAALFRLL
jgi:serine/threonine protein kinase